MNKNIMLSVLALLLCAVEAIAENGKQWSLGECIEYAMANNITLKKTQLARLSATEDRKQASAALLPSLSASTNQSVGYRPWVNDGVSTVSNGTVATSVNKSYYNGSYGINASWTVWNGNQNRNNVKLNRIAEKQAELDSAATANNIQEQIAQLYVQILYLKEVIGVTRHSHETSLKNEERGREMMEAGKMSKADLAQLTAQTAQDKYSMVEAESNLANYKLQLKQLLEITDDEDFDISAPTASDEQALGDIPALRTVYEAALTARPEIENGRLGIESSKLNVAIAKAGKLPTVSLTGGVGTSTTSMNSKAWGTQIKTNFDASVGATLSVPIFDNRKTRTAINKARLQHEESILDLQDKQKQLYSTVEGYWLDANTNQQKFRAAMASTESEQASYDLLSEQFRLGLKNIVELMTGKNNLLNAQQNRLQSKYMTILDMQLLNFYRGETMNI
ncbi:MAG: TolC family protein [Prevotella sp.]|nr:TolC family protein [Prevotella sp.]